MDGAAEAEAEAHMEKQLVCGFCHRPEESKIMGPLLRKNRVVAHENCLFYSSGIYHRDNDNKNELQGFEEKDVMEEIRRGRFLKCYRCKTTGATVGCEVKKCKRSYHYPCAILDNAKTVENIKRGIFKMYCELHRQFPSGMNGEFAVHLLDTHPSLSWVSPSPWQIPLLRSSLPFFFSRRKIKVVRNQYIHFKLAFWFVADEKFDVEQAPLENDLEEQNVSLISQFFFTANVSPSYNENQDDTDIDSDQGSQSLLLPIKIHNLETVASCSPDDHPCSSSTTSLSPGCNFWSKCHEAGCVESIFSTFISSMITLSEKILSKQASDDECNLCFNVLVASGMLPDIMTRKEQECEEKILNLKKEKEALQTALSVMSSLSEKSSSLVKPVPAHNTS
ncbi:hypothetical protein GN956_G3945 [Arapaima gigas]